ncbi:hypothetical protein BDW22DRAFT_1351210 [Trametopsis cervina]|nr:hypothetical protein BDW22DRAFT_1351210 [Trametopsis cervina]
MVDWTSLSEVTKDADVLANTIFVFFGVFVWEIFQTAGFEWSLITRTRKFTWPLVLFFLSRYGLLSALVGLIVSFEEKSPIDCQALYTWNAITGNLAILAASSSLIVRTLALWERKLFVAVPLGILALAHWAILWRGMFIIDAQYSSEAQGCVVNSTNHGLLMASFFSTMGVDLIVLCFTIAALMRQKVHSSLWKMLFQDGLVYFCVTFLCNAVPAVLSVLDLNAVMNIIGTIPAATVSTIAAGRLVMRLQDFSINGGSSLYVSTSSGNAYANQFAVAMSHRYPNNGRTPEIRVTTDHYVVEDFT